MSVESSSENVSECNPLAEIIQVQEVIPHPNADALDLISPDDVNWAIVVRGTLKVGDLVVWLDAMNDPIVPAQRPEFAVIAGRAKGKPTYRIRAMRLRGVLSTGLVIPYDPSYGETNEDVIKFLGVTKALEQMPKANQGCEVGGPDNLLPVVKYDVEGLAGKAKVIPPGAIVWFTEKIHGANGSFGHLEYKKVMEFRLRSRSWWKHQTLGGIWTEAAKITGLEEKLRPYPGILVYGEVFGQVQDLTYARENADFMAFDVWDSNVRRWYSWKETEDFCSKVGIPTVPCFGKFTWPSGKGIPAFSSEMAEGKTAVPGGAEHIREGIVVRWDGEMSPGFPYWYLSAAMIKLGVTPNEGESQEDLSERVLEALKNEPQDQENLYNLGFMVRDSRGIYHPSAAGKALQASPKNGSIRVILKLVGESYLTRKQ